MQYFRSMFLAFSARARWARPVLILAITLALAVTAIGFRQAEAPAAGTAPVRQTILPGLEYLGTASCAGAECHTADKAKLQSGQLIGDENNIWDAGDPHSHAFRSIAMNYKSQRHGVETAAIAAKLNIADTATSARCLDCHAVHAPETQRGDKFRLASGVSCEACHGPAEKWREPHAKEGWTAALRKEIGADGLREQWGLIDTSNLAVRARTCVACHLQIDKALVDAGHPPLQYDQYRYNTVVYKFFGYFDSNPNNDNTPDFTHWSDPPGVPFSAKLWATGIAASLESAEANLKQWNATAGDGSPAANLRDWYAQALGIVKKHFGADTVEALAAANVTEAAAKAAAADLAALAPDAKTPAARWGIAQGIAALGDIMTNGDEGFWNGYNDATDNAAAGGEKYLAAIKLMMTKMQ